MIIFKNSLKGGKLTSHGVGTRARQVVEHGARAGPEGQGRKNDGGEKS